MMIARFQKIVEIVVLFALIVLVGFLTTYGGSSQTITQDLPASGNLTWDPDFLRLTSGKFRRQMNPNRGVAIVAVPTDRDPARSLDELAAGRIVGSIYTPVAGQYFNVSLKSPSLFVVRVSRRGDRWVADLLDGNRVVTTVPATVQDGLVFWFSLKWKEGALG